MDIQVATNNYVSSYLKQGYSEDEIRDALKKSKVSREVINKAFKNQEKMMSRLRWSVLLSIIFFVIIIFLALFILLNLQGCSNDSDCPSGYMCYDGNCAKSEGLVNCEVISCDPGYDCYKCLKETMI